MNYVDVLNNNSSTIQHTQGCLSSNAVVASAHYEASRIGIEVMKMGGNAFDSAVAVGFALTVCEPSSSSLGGGGYMNATFEGKPIFVDFREVAPSKANPYMWSRDENGKIIGDQKLEGGKSVCIPGEVAGMCFIHKTYGKLPLEKVLEPVIKLAEEGFIVSSLFCNDTKNERDKILRYSCENVYTKDYSVGDKFVNKDLANTIRIIAKDGGKSFYEGDLANLMIESINKNGGDVSVEDFKNYEVTVKEPLSSEYRGFQVVSSPPPSSGGTHVIQALNILENFDLNKMGFHSSSHLHLLSEVFKRCFADRSKFMADPNFADIPLKGLTSKEYAKNIAEEISFEISSPAKTGNPWDYEPTDTTHFSIADVDGNLVSITKTISSFYGSGIVPKGMGFALNCQMRGFSADIDSVNSVEGGKKPLSSMSPTMILKDGKPYCVLGSPGANRIITTVVQIISNLIDFNYDLQTAISNPRIYDDNKSKLVYEKNIDIDVIDALKKLGHDTVEKNEHDRYMGGVQAIKFIENNKLEGAADPRRDGKALGY